MTSTRNLAHKNIILKGPGGKDTAPLPMLKAMGRSSFFVGDDGSRKAEVSVSDLKYNATLGTN
jgi:hypothetical protein